MIDRVGGVICFMRTNVKGVRLRNGCIQRFNMMAKK